MIIPIKNPIVLLIGPTTSGKSTLAKKIQNECEGDSILLSHDEILKLVDPNQPQEQIDYEFRVLYIMALHNAVLGRKDRLIIVDALDLQCQNVLAFLSVVRMAGYQGRVTLLKMNLSSDLHFRFCKERNDQQLREATTNAELQHTILNQVDCYHGPNGSFRPVFPYTDEFKITDPREIEFTYSYSTNSKQKKIR